ncbi:hypothetical protein ENUP19_0040G0029 [Entamoeba nuttalli]|uniref:Cysteine protease n=1 Tax=Entamoeba nuttalli TaxID=412467 RepID=A0ABQ0D9V4_9EUKA
MEVGSLNVIEAIALGENETEVPKKRENKKDIDDFARHTIWITYRKNMPLIKEKTTDSGWGCMIRSLQMALAQTFLSIVLGNNWKYEDNCINTERNIFHIKSIINLFGDSTGCLFSIHRLVARASTRGVTEGQWWGPSFASDIAAEHINEMRVFRTRGYVAKLGSIIGSKIEELIKDGGGFNPCIIFVPLRLGPESPENEFRPLLKTIFDIPQCMGMIGGKPGYAHYFHTFDGINLYFLDPHTTQNAIDMKGDWSYQSYFCKDNKSMLYSKMDPSISLVFLVKHANDYEHFKKSFENKTFSKLFTFKDETEKELNSDDFISLDDDDIDLIK